MASVINLYLEALGGSGCGWADAGGSPRGGTESECADFSGSRATAFILRPVGATAFAVLRFLKVAFNRTGSANVVGRRAARANLVCSQASSVVGVPFRARD